MSRLDHTPEELQSLLLATGALGAERDEERAVARLREIHPGAMKCHESESISE